jgi:BirA family biotin operon repressor/biotin-[acetyl-CoA-carboxylase] ligase
VSVPEPLDWERLKHHLSELPVGHTIHYYQQAPSTMPIAHQLAGTAGIRSGTVVLAEEQTAGRGRLERRWEAPNGQALLMSVIFKPPWSLPFVQLPMLVGVALVRALEKWEPRLQGQVGLKWPNDLLLGKRRQAAGKVAGILIESAWQGDQPAYAIVGIGININQLAADLPLAQAGAPSPTSVRLYLQEVASNNQPEPTLLDRNGVLLALCTSLSHLIQETTRDPRKLVREWRTHLWTLGTAVSVLADGLPLWHGQAVEVTEEGNLLVEATHGEQRAFAAGDVTIRM